MSGFIGAVRKAKAVCAAGLLCLVTGAELSAKEVTAGVILKEMPTKEFVVYVTGMIEGMAYARFRKDTLAAGQKVETGSVCILNWYHGNSDSIVVISDTFRKYPDYAPWVVLGSMIKKECGE